MNFKRIELIFLLTFLAIDIFLFGMVRQNQNMQTENVSQNNSNATIIKEMRNDQIKVGDLSDINQTAYYVAGTKNNLLREKMGQLTNQQTSFVDNKLRSNFNEPINVSTKSPQKTISKMLTDSTFVLYGTEYHYNSELSSSHQLVYAQTAMGRDIYTPKGQLIFNLNSDYQLIGYTQQYLTDIKGLREQSETISEQRAVIWLYQYNEIPNNTKIAWSKLGYTKLIDIDNNVVMIPTWVIAIKYNSSTIQIKRINAFTGSLIKSSTASNVKETVND